MQIRLKTLEQLLNDPSLDVKYIEATGDNKRYINISKFQHQYDISAQNKIDQLGKLHVVRSYYTDGYGCDSYVIGGNYFYEWAVEEKIP